MDLISITQEKGTIFKAQVRNHSFLSDMSVKDGGTDKAPSPAELLVSALGFCIVMILQRYCESHGYDAQGINLSMTYLLDDNPKMISNITIDIGLPDNFPDDRRQALLNAIKTCVIYNSLNKNTLIDIEFED
jgi:ribosomal protein S12 methylthiotransferase accessory factor